MSTIRSLDLPHHSCQSFLSHNKDHGDAWIPVCTLRSSRDSQSHAHENSLSRAFVLINNRGNIKGIEPIFSREKIQKLQRKIVNVR